MVTGQGAANHAMDDLRAMFNYAILQKYMSGSIPAAGQDKFPSESRERFLLGGEASKFFNALMEEPNVTARDCMMMKLLTGARRANVHAMRWAHIDWQDEVWRIPKTKNGTGQTVPLVPEALALLAQRRENARRNAEWVFPADRSDSKHGHVGNLKSQWARVITRSGLKNLRQHDLRRTLGSWQAANGATLLLIGKSLNHKHPSSTAIYAKLDIDPVRASIAQATGAIFAAAGVKSSANVIQMPLPASKTPTQKTGKK
jgi:integrase